jgi:hypothetical protein
VVGIVSALAPVAQQQLLNLLLLLLVVWLSSAVAAEFATVLQLLAMTQMRAQCPVCVYVD